MGKADNILNKISEYQRELVKIQNNCGHTKKEIKFIHNHSHLILKYCYQNHFENHSLL